MDFIRRYSGNGGKIMFHTIQYKIGYIHLSHIDKKETVKVQIIDLKRGLFFIKQVKSFFAAKIFITKFEKSLMGEK
jgi:hypothetical protein